MSPRRAALVRGVPMRDCRACQRPIRFVLLDTGSLMPVDPMPDDRGNVAARRIGRQLHGHMQHRGTPPADMFRMLPHHATCAERTRTTPPPRPPADPALF